MPVSVKEDLNQNGVTDVGLRCPKCGCRHFYTIATRKTWGNRITRRRECRHCGKRVTTSERIIGGA